MAVLTAVNNPFAVLIGILVLALAGAIVGWYLTRPESDEPRTVQEIATAPAARTSGANSPATSASHSGVGDIRIDQSSHYTGVREPEPVLYRGERILGKSAEELTAYYGIHTSLQADRLVQPFLGKPLVVIGQLQNASALGDGAQIYAQDGEGRWLTGEFSAEWLDRLAEVNRGDRVSFVGRINGIAERTVDLGDCELLDH